MPNALSDIFEQVRNWIETDLAFQMDPLASFIAVIALLTARRADRRSANMMAAERDRAGNISHVIIHEHSLQAAMRGSLKKSRTTSQRDADAPEGFVCSVYSGDTDVEVESVYLKIVFIKGVFGQERWEIRVDIQSSEGLAVPATPLPFRMPPNSRLDWIFPSFVTFFPSRRGLERKLGVERLMSPNEQLCFEFGAYSRVSGTPVTTSMLHRLGIFGFPARGGPWTKVVKHSSLWDALTSPSCPDSLKGWFLEWLECHENFQERIDADESNMLRDWFHQAVFRHYWPPIPIRLEQPKPQFGDPENNTREHRVKRTLLMIPDMTPIDSGRTISGPGGSSELSRFRIGLAMSILDGTVPPVTSTSNISSWPSGLTIDDSVLEAATGARHLCDLGDRRTLTQKEGETLTEHLSVIGLELSRCTYMSPSDPVGLVAEFLRLREELTAIESERFSGSSGSRM